MSVRFSSDEVLEMAERIERNGAAFYRRAAEIATDARVKQRLIQLAEWEGGHEKLFAKLRETLSGAEKESPTYDPNGDAVYYLREMADRHVFNIHSDLNTLLKGNETSQQVLDIALGFERDSILFFQGLEAITPASLGKEKVRALIEEEMGHVAYLARERAALAEK